MQPENSTTLTGLNQPLLYSQMRKIKETILKIINFTYDLKNKSDRYCAFFDWYPLICC